MSQGCAAAEAVTHLPSPAARGGPTGSRQPQEGWLAETQTWLPRFPSKLGSYVLLGPRWSKSSCHGLAGAPWPKRLSLQGPLFSSPPASPFPLSPSGPTSQLRGPLECGPKLASKLPFSQTLALTSPPLLLSCPHSLDPCRHSHWPFIFLTDPRIRGGVSTCTLQIQPGVLQTQRSGPPARGGGGPAGRPPGQRASRRRRRQHWAEPRLSASRDGAPLTTFPVADAHHPLPMGVTQAALGPGL